MVGGSDGLAKNTRGLTQTEEIGVKSLIGSYGAWTNAVGLMACVDEVATSSV